MAQRDLTSNVHQAVALAPVAVTATATGLTVDTRGFDSVMFIIQTGVVTTADATNFITPSAQHSDSVDGSSVMTNAVAVTAAELEGTFTVINDTTPFSGQIYAVGYKGNRRYVRLIFTETLTASAILGAVVLLGHAHLRPA